MTRNRRYEDRYDALNDERRAKAAPAPVTVPSGAFGPHPIEWAPKGAKPPVWVWMPWPDRPQTREMAVARGWNDRVVIVEWDGVGGMRSTVVWRNAVTKRSSE